MANPSVEAAIKAYFASHYVGTFPYRELDNVTDDDMKKAALTQFYAIDFLPIGGEARKSIGNPGSNAFEETGSFQVLVYTRSNVGANAAKAEAQVFRDLIRNVRSIPLVQIDYAGPPNGDWSSDDGSWYVAAVSVDFTFQTFH